MAGAIADVATYGWRTLKATGGARLMRRPNDEGLTVRVLEGYSGWKEGMVFTRHFREASGKPHLYRLDCLRADDMSLVATAFGRTNGETWEKLYEALKRQGVMPPDARG